MMFENMTAHDIATKPAKTFYDVDTIVDQTESQHVTHDIVAKPAKTFNDADTIVEQPETVPVMTGNKTQPCNNYYIHNAVTYTYYLITSKTHPKITFLMILRRQKCFSKCF